MGATSTVIAGLTGKEKIQFERDVFAAQWGQNETGTGSSNSLYVTEAFVNFGHAGVVIFSVLVGLILRFFAQSKDEAFRSLWMLFALGVYTAPLTGMLFSNGFLVLMLISARIRFDPAPHVGPSRVAQGAVT